MKFLALLRESRRRAFTDLAILFIAGVGVLIISSSFDLFEKIVTFVEAREAWQLDEWITVLIVLLPCLLVFSLRRWQETAREMSVRRMVEANLLHSRQRLEILHSIDNSILAGQSAEQVAKLVLRAVVDEVTVPAASIALFDMNANEEMIFVIPFGKTLPADVGTRYPLTVLSSDDLDKLRRGETQVIDDTTTWEKIPPGIQVLQLGGIPVFFRVPLNAEGALVGCLNIGARSVNEMSAENLQVLRELANQFAIAIQQARLREQIRRHTLELEERVAERTTELLQANRHIEAILDSSSDAIILVNADGIIRQVNPAFTQLIGCEAGAAVGKLLTSLLQLNDVIDFQDALTQAVHTQDAVRLEGEIRSLTQEPRTVDIALSPLVQEAASSQLPTMVCSLRDINERKQAELALRESEERFKSLFEFAPNAYYITDGNGVFIDLNRAGEKLLGEPREALIGKSFFDMSILPETQLPLAYQLVHQNMQGQAAGMHEFTILRRDGSQVTIDSTSMPIKIGGDTRILSISHDVSVRKQVEEGLRVGIKKEKELNQLKTRFISMVSHDFRNPLTSILTSSEMLRLYGARLTEAEKVIKYDSIRAQVNHLIALLEDVLMIGRAEIGTAAINRKPLDLARLCQTVVDEQRQIAENPDRIVFTNEGVRPTILGDAKLLRQVIINLLTNAIKYSPTDTIVRLDLIFDDNHYVMRVQDQGIGISKADQEHLFETFYRATNVGEIPGTGLGLAIVKLAVEAHKGQLTVESELGMGTLFTIRLPVQ